MFATIMLTGRPPLPMSDSPAAARAVSAPPARHRGPTIAYLSPVRFAHYAWPLWGIQAVRDGGHSPQAGVEAVVVIDGRANMIEYEQLASAVGGSAVGLRLKLRLEPAGGSGDKVFPPTYDVGNEHEPKYAIEKRVVGDDGETQTAVLMDSVASQANRLELGLLEGWEAKELDFPVAYVDFSEQPGLADLDRITVLEAPHRIADALFRDSMLDGTLFRMSDVGHTITESSPKDATGLFTYCPTALLFGMWDSTGPKGGLGSKFQRALVSEIVGHRAETGSKTGSRIDPLSIEAGAGPVFRHTDPDEEWTLDEDAAAKDSKNRPIPFDRKGGSGAPGAPSKINHGNVTPSIDDRAGGVTISHAVQTLVLSFAALRRLRFVRGADGDPLPRERRRGAETAARTAIAALGIAAIAYQHQRDYDLRSRCLLVPTAAPQLELLPRDGSTPETFDIDEAGAQRLLTRASTEAADHGLAWHDDDLALTPAPKLVELIRRSRHLVSDAAED